MRFGALIGIVKHLALVFTIQAVLFIVWERVRGGSGRLFVFSRRITARTPESHLFPVPNSLTPLNSVRLELLFSLTLNLLVYYTVSMSCVSYPSLFARFLLVLLLFSAAKEFVWNEWEWIVLIFYVWVLFFFNRATDWLRNTLENIVTNSSHAHE